MKRVLSIILAAILPLVSMSAKEEARLLRFPSVGGDKIAFTYAGDLYIVPINGGEAVRLTSDIGYEMFSRFSPDGKTIAFTAQYDGNTEVYTIPAEGGSPKRITYTATVDRDDIGDRMGPNNIVMCWTPDGKNIVFRTKWHTFSGLRGQLYSISAEGGEPVRIPTTEGGFCSYSPDGSRLALNRMFREFRTWKYYRGGQADDIWINTVGTTELQNITNNDAQDIFPMWIGDEIYYMSDRDQIMNLFCYNTVTGATSKVTDFTEYDCKFPSFSKDYIVFENGGYIYKYSIAGKTCEKVPVYLNAEGIYSRNKLYTKEDAGRSRSSYSLAPDGSRLLSNLRGDIFSLPVSEGATYNLTSTPGAHDRNAVWSPDGRQIAYFSDESGEYQVYVMPFDNPSAKVCLTSFEDGYPSSLTWSPDSKVLYFTNEKKELLSLEVATRKLSVVFEGKYGGPRGFDISYDGNWIAYSASLKSGVSAVFIYDVKKGTHTQVTTDWYNSYSPMFSDDGKYLFFSSSRDFRAIYSQVEWNAAYSVSNYIFVLPLTKEVPAVGLIEGVEYKLPATPVKEEDSKNSRKKGKAAPKETAEPSMTIDFDGIVERASALPLKSGSASMVAAFGGDLYFMSSGKLKKISIDGLKVSDVSDCSVLSFTPDYKKALVSRKGTLAVVDVPSFRGDASIPTEDMRVMIDYRAEWNQIFNETWRIYRDYFYVENMVGRDWKAIHDKYAVFLPYVNHRHDLTYIIGEMIGELATGHCYVNTGEVARPERIHTGLLGAIFSKDKASGAFRIDKIFEGVSWGDTRRSPLGQPGLNVKAGDFVLEINGRPASELGTIYEALIGRVGITTALRVNDRPVTEGSRVIYVKPIADETQLAYFDWVQNNIRKVSEASNGRIGYIHIPDMSVAGLDEFTRLFYSQLDKEALIIDDRMNGGGNVSPMIIERLQRVVYRMNMYRNGGEQLATIPESTHYGPKVCLVDKYSSSDGDLFPYSFQKLKLGKLIGTRTWGGIVGISGSKPYLDGQDVRTPFFTTYSTEGEWVIENRGVEPDIFVDLNPFEDYLGNDAQLNKAIEVLLEELKDYKPLPGVPADPVR